MAESHSKDKLHGVMSIFFGVLFLATTSILILNFGSTDLNVTHDFATSTVMILVLIYSVIFFVAFINFWADAAMAKLHRWVHDDRKRMEEFCIEHPWVQKPELWKDQQKDHITSYNETMKEYQRLKYLLGNRSCAYCGHKMAPLICSKCQCVQWSDLKHLRRIQLYRNDLHKNNEVFLELGHEMEAPGYWQLAGFISYYRWYFITAVASLMAMTILAAGSQLSTALSFHLQKEQEVQTTHAKALIETMTDLRSSMATLETYCYNSSDIIRKDKISSDTPPQTPDVSSDNCRRVHPIENGQYKDDFCAKQFKAVTTNYLKLSWQAPILIEYLQRRTCHKDLSGLKKEACHILEKGDALEPVDALFSELSEEHRRLVNEKDTVQSSQTCQGMQGHIDNLRCAVFSLGCLLQVTTFSSDEKNFHSFDPCRTQMDPHSEMQREDCVSGLQEKRKNQP